MLVELYSSKVSWSGFIEVLDEYKKATTNVENFSLILL
jgi:hypothetical protein